MQGMATLDDYVLPWVIVLSKKKTPSREKAESRQSSATRSRPANKTEYDSQPISR